MPCFLLILSFFLWDLLCSLRLASHFTIFYLHLSLEQIPSLPKLASSSVPLILLSSLIYSLSGMAVEREDSRFSTSKPIWGNLFGHGTKEPLRGLTTRGRVGGVPLLVLKTPDFCCCCCTHSIVSLSFFLLYCFYLFAFPFIWLLY